MSPYSSEARTDSSSIQATPSLTYREYAAGRFPWFWERHQFRSHGPRSLFSMQSVAAHRNSSSLKMVNNGHLMGQFKLRLSTGSYPLWEFATSRSCFCLASLDSMATKQFLKCPIDNSSGIDGALSSDVAALVLSRQLHPCETFFGCQTLIFFWKIFPVFSRKAADHEARICSFGDVDGFIVMAP